MDWIIKGGMLLGDSGMEQRDLFIADGVIAEAPAKGARVVDATDLIVAPGIVDLHGDGFERHFSPRPGVFFDIETALIETDRQLLVNGITTAYLAMTISWEPGLRSLDNAKMLVDAWSRLRPDFATDMRLQLRWEAFALDAVDVVEEWLSLDPAPMLAFNDHFSMLIDDKARLGRDLSDYAVRAGLTRAEYDELTERTAARQNEVAPAIQRLAAAAAKLGVPCLAHDEMTADARRANRALGIDVSEFPMSRAAAEEAIAGGDATVLGAPNVVRGGSHIGALNAEPAAIDGLCTSLASDYYYPSLMGAAARMLEAGDLPAPAVWRLVSGSPANAARLHDRGRLDVGARADVVVFRRASKRAVVEACVANGALAYSRLAAR